MIRVNLQNLETVASYAAKFNYSVPHVYKLINDGKLKTHMVGKIRLIVTDGKL